MLECQHGECVGFVNLWNGFVNFEPLGVQGGMCTQHLSCIQGQSGPALISNTSCIRYFLESLRMQQACTCTRVPSAPCLPLPQVALNPLSASWLSPLYSPHGALTGSAVAETFKPPLEPCGTNPHFSTTHHTTPLSTAGLDIRPASTAWSLYVADEARRIGPGLRSKCPSWQL